MTMAPREREKARCAHASVRETTTTMLASELGRRACAKGVVIAVLLIKIWKIILCFCEMQLIGISQGSGL
jgi:hypothetical protein